jgi:glycosyltransferase involved in cell wall biosynthesis
MKSITVFTPTYNRAYCLNQLYESLVNQTNQDFIWLVIDDGSTDNTSAVVQKWIDESKISIQYHEQANIGMVGAHNTAHYMMETELCVCMDSDDYMPDNAIERILALWSQYGYPESAGLVGLDSFSDNKIVGTKLPENVKECKFSELFVKYNVSGDKKFIHNRKVFNNYLPYPFFDGEKFPITSYLYLFIEQKHKILLFNEVFCIVEYMPDGLSMNLFNQYKESPKSFAHYRKAKMQFALNHKERFKNAIHYISSSLMAKNYNFIKESPFKLTILLALPFGICLYFYLMNTKKKAILKTEKK